jgi:hypothetical protein
MKGTVTISEQSKLVMSTFIRGVVGLESEVNNQ